MRTRPKSRHSSIAHPSIAQLAQPSLTKSNCGKNVLSVMMQEATLSMLAAIRAWTQVAGGEGERGRERGVGGRGEGEA